ncbi:hypothetical protein [Henriciella marina]|uniref:hypothetical protein n=1 Tax=Henriciella marina TaxID=453851 RepID=UPI00036BC61E|nr:hypothetical protein [Henriciella marina]
MSDRPSLDDQQNYFAQHPPRILSGLEKFLVDSAIGQGGHGEALGTSFELGCVCGSARLKIEAAKTEWKGESLFVVPVRLECASCRKVVEFFDPELHGYDGELGHNKHLNNEARPQLSSVETVDTSQLVASFFYMDDLFCDDFPVDGASVAKEDLFSWFALFERRCDGKAVLLIEEECA